MENVNVLAKSGRFIPQMYFNETPFSLIKDRTPLTPKWNSNTALIVSVYTITTK